MSLWISLFNNLAVSLFGSVLSASFCDALDTRRKRWIFWLCMILISLMQGWIYSVWDEEFLRRIYPLIVHLPLLLLLWGLTGKILWPLVSILSAYLCCEVRRWAALIVVAALHGGAVMQDAVELAVTLPLLILLLRLFAPVIRPLAEDTVQRRCVFGLVPAVYYLFDYGTRVYTDLLYSGGPAAVEFMPFVCCLVYMAFLLYHSSKERTQSQLRQVQKNLDMQLNQAVREIDALRQSQTLASRYRHDLRHHLQYLSACIENGQTEQAQSYITGVCSEIEAHKVQRYCENEAANLILSAFAGRAEREGVSMTIHCAIPAFILVSDSDLCVLLSNALENALYACRPLVAEGRACSILVQAYKRQDKLFLQVTNPCAGEVRFEKGVPVSDRPGHGIGVQSICAIVSQYGGVCSFTVKDGQFILRLSV